ncbi:6349_t:CDS:2 [Entrophospora sp. SA101]|nr:6349_t:CDS:2 [Entrophospora sp. SA101]
MNGYMKIDLEWNPFIRDSKVSLIQLCDDSNIYLIHIARMKLIPSILYKILESKDIYKLGCNINNDARRLFKGHNIKCKSLLELSSLCLQVKQEHFLNRRSRIIKLSKMVEVLLNHEIAKPRHIVMSNWSSNFLSEAQKEYAATDAYANYVLAKRIDDLQCEVNNRDVNYEITLYDIDDNGMKIETKLNNKRLRDVFAEVAKVANVATSATLINDNNPNFL